MAVFTGPFEGIKVFSSTMAAERAQMSDRITEWLERNKGTIFIVGSVVTQSSDSAFHCVTITLFYNGKAEWDSPPPERRDRGNYPPPQVDKRR